LVVGGTLAHRSKDRAGREPPRAISRRSASALGVGARRSARLGSARRGEGPKRADLDGGRGGRVVCSRRVARLLFVDDDPNIREVVRVALERAGHGVDLAADGREGLERFGRGDHDLVILDIVMPEHDGIEVCRRIRQTSVVPILFLSSRDDELDRIIGLEVGGDDYMTKPFSPRELVARVKAMLRRVALLREPPKAAAAPLSAGDLRLDPERFELTWAGRALVLTVTEFGVLETLLRAPGKVFTRDELVERAYRFDNHVTERTIDTHVKRIRKKFDSGGEPIETVYGLGYRLGACKAAAP
jgi:two-component system OmpR family response regulator